MLRVTGLKVFFRDDFRSRTFEPSVLVGDTLPGLEPGAHTASKSILFRPHPTSLASIPPLGAGERVVPPVAGASPPGCWAGVSRVVSVSPEAAIRVEGVFASSSVVEGSTTDCAKGFSTLLMINESAITISGSAALNTAREAARTPLSGTDLFYRENGGWAQENSGGHSSVRGGSVAVVEVTSWGGGGGEGRELNLIR